MSEHDDLFNHEADVVVVGSGGAGYAAAVSAALDGASVLILEWADTIGGTTAAGGATVWVPNNTSMRQLHGLEDPRHQALQYMCRLAYPDRYDPTSLTLGLAEDAYDLIATFYDEGSRALDFLADADALHIESDLRYPDYHADLPEDVVPRGRHMRPPAGAPSLLEQLANAGERLGVRVLTGHRVVAAVKNSAGELVGVEAHAGTRTVLVRAHRAVVFGTGGFLHDRELVQTFLQGRVFGGCSVPTTAGDFVRIGQQLGAQLGSMHRAFWKQVLVEQALQTEGLSIGSFLPFGDSMIQVNKYGQRVVNEKSPYNERSQVHFHWHPSRREYPNLLLFMIWDDAVAQSPLEWPFRPPVPMPGESSPWVVSGDTLEQLSDYLDERLLKIAEHTGGAALDDDFLPNLAATIERFNDFARSGEDLDFFRGETPIEVDWNGPGRPGSPNPTMAPLSTEGPYHCAILGAGVLDTNGGPKINTSAQVLDHQGNPIPGLYGAGNCVASILGQGYWGPGATIGPALTYGYLAGRNASSEKPKALD